MPGTARSLNQVLSRRSFAKPDRIARAKLRRFLRRQRAGHAGSETRLRSGVAQRHLPEKGRLHVPDSRAGESTFQLITQLAGRAGRGDLEGEVIVQTYTPHLPSIQYARRHDFDGFSKQEMEFRRQICFPPFAHCAVLTLRRSSTWTR